MDTTQWAQGIGVVKHHHPMEGTSNSKANNNQVLERRARPQKGQALNCPRCNSTNTKFCYYNNYSLSQPRYFCKTCRRYWTEGGSLRNVPVGGGSRKNKRSTPSSSTTTTTTPSTSTTSSQQEASKNKLLHPDLMTTTTPTPNINTFHHIHQSSSHQNPKIQYQGQDLNLAYPPQPDQDYNHLQTSAMELLKTGISTSSSSRGLNYSNFMPPPMSLSESSPMYNNNNNSSTIGGFPPLQDFKAHQGLSFSLEGFENGSFGSSTLHGIHQENGGARILFPVVEDLKQQVPNSTTATTASQGDSTHHGYWNGMLGGGSW